MPAIFYFDLASPYSYLAAERIDGLFDDAGLERPEWRPILFGALVKELGRTPWGLTDGKEEHVAEIERRAAAYGRPPLAWPDPLPANSLHAMRAATVAATAGPGCARDFALAAYREAFARGRDLGDDEVIAAAGAAGIGPQITDGITPAEEMLIEAGRFEEVRTNRTAFQDAIEPIMRESVERISGRSVSAFLSQISLGGLAGEVFVLNSVIQPA